MSDETPAKKPVKAPRKKPVKKPEQVSDKGRKVVRFGVTMWLKG